MKVFENEPMIANIDLKAIFHCYRFQIEQSKANQKLSRTQQYSENYISNVFSCIFLFCRYFPFSWFDKIWKEKKYLPAYSSPSSFKFQIYIKINCYKWLTYLEDFTSFVHCKEISWSWLGRYIWKWFGYPNIFQEVWYCLGLTFTPCFESAAHFKYLEKASLVWSSSFFSHWKQFAIEAELDGSA